MNAEELEIIHSDKDCLAEYVVKTKIKSVKKTAVIVAIITSVLSFGAGMFYGVYFAKTSAQDNVVKILVENKEAEEQPEGK